MSLAAFLLACLSKEVSFFLPAGLLAWDALEPRSAGGPPWWRRNALWLAGWVAVLALVLAVRWWIVGVGVGMPPRSAAAPPAPRPLYALGTLVTYLRLLILPWPLRAYYSATQVALTPLSVAAASLLIALCAGAARSRWGRAGLYAAVWILGFLLPVLGAVRLAGAPLAERFLYLPSVGLCALPAVVGALRDRWRPRALAAAGVALALLAGATALRARVWESEFTLFADLIRTTPDVAVGYEGLGNAHFAQRRHEEALRLHRQAAEVDPAFAEAHGNIGSDLIQLGRLPEAEAALRRAISLDPGAAAFHNNLGVLLEKQGRYREAVEAYLQALRLHPQFAQAYVNLGFSYERLGRQDDAVAAFAAALRLNPASAEAHFNLGTSQLKAENNREAAENLAQAVALAPGNPEARFNLGLAWARLGRRSEAEEQRRALQSLSPELAARLERVLAAGPGR